MLLTCKLKAENLEILRFWFQYTKHHIQMHIENQQRLGTLNIECTSIILSISWLKLSFNAWKWEIQSSRSRFLASQNQWNVDLFCMLSTTKGFIGYEYSTLSGSLCHKHSKATKLKVKHDGVCRFETDYNRLIQTHRFFDTICVCCESYWNIKFYGAAVGWVNVYTIYFVHALARLSTINIYQDIDT